MSCSWTSWELHPPLLVIRAPGFTQTFAAHCACFPSCFFSSDCRCRDCLCHRDLPQYGHKQWQSYFGRTFDVYTKLWKFQQQHRLVHSPDLKSLQRNKRKFCSCAGSLCWCCCVVSCRTDRCLTLATGWRGGRSGRWPPRLDSSTTTTSESAASPSPISLHCSSAWVVLWLVVSWQGCEEAWSDYTCQSYQKNEAAVLCGFWFWQLEAPRLLASLEKMWASTLDDVVEELSKSTSWEKKT